MKKYNTQDLEKYHFILCIAVPAFILGLIILTSGAMTLVSAQSMDIDIFSMTHAEFREASSQRFDMFQSGSAMIGFGFFITFFLGLPLLGSYYNKVKCNDNVKLPGNPYDVKRVNTVIKQKPKEEPKKVKSQAIFCQFCGKALSSLEARCGYCKVLIRENENDKLQMEVLIE